MRKALALLLVLFLCGCQPTAVISDENLLPVQAYYISSEQLLAPREVAISVTSEEAKIRTLYSALQENQDASLSPAITSDVLLEDYTLHGHTLTLKLSSHYDSYSGLSRTLADAALTLSFCGLSEVDQLIIQTNTFESAPMTPSNYVFSAPMPESSLLTLDLYFVLGGELATESRAISQDDSVLLVHDVVSALLAGPETAGLQSAIPSGTKLHSAVVENGVCTIDLSAKFLALPTHTEDAERLCLFSLVNTLSGVPDVEQVRILIDGASIPGFTHYDLTQTFQSDGLH